MALKNYLIINKNAYAWAITTLFTTVKFHFITTVRMVELLYDTLQTGQHFSPVCDDFQEIIHILHRVQFAGMLIIRKIPTGLFCWTLNLQNKCLQPFNSFTSCTRLEHLPHFSLLTLDTTDSRRWISWSIFIPMAKNITNDWKKFECNIFFSICVLSLNMMT